MDINLYGAVMPHMLDNAGLGSTQASAGGHHGQLDHVRRAHCGSAICATAEGVGLIGCSRFIAGLGLGGPMPLCLAMVMEFAPPRRAALTTGLLMTWYHAGGMAATDSGPGRGLAPGLLGRRAAGRDRRASAAHTAAGSARRTAGTG